jgi:diaminohydroxyphosphoribosylaminopyrimidine deaminase/5-amino-6-(5-phosphoribosylamino)uracil reductase
MTSAGAVRESPARARALIDVGARIEALGGSDLASALTHLGTAQVTSLLLEGGPTLHASAWDAGLVDCVQLYVAPITLGKEGVPWLAGDPLAGLVDTRELSFGSDVFTEGYVHRTY